jgi:NADPH-dependent 2,4-dienoyl-CoA reductase/sulfur reductase-like enzyme
MKVIVIGGDAAGMSAASQIKRRKKDWDVIVFERGDYISYAACGIPYYIQGIVNEADSLIEVTPEEAIHERKVDLRLRHEVIQIIPSEKKVIVKKESGELEESYDKLMIATGARPNTLNIDLKDMKNVFTIQNIPEAIAVKKHIMENKPSRIAILGGGYIGIEMAEAVHDQCIETQMIHRRDDLHRAFEKEISDIIKENLIEKGIVLKFSQSVKTIKNRGDRIAIITDKEEIEVDAAILAIGVIPNSELARDAGIELGLNNAIRVNKFMETNIPDIYAAGDCAVGHLTNYDIEVYTPLALKANKQGMIGGVNMTGSREPFKGIINTAITKFFDLGIARTGLSFAEAESMGLEPVKYLVKSRDRAQYYPGASQITSLVIVSKKDRRILGAQLIGKAESVKRIDTYSTALYNQMTIDELFDLDTAYAPPFSPVYDPVLRAARVGKKMV